MAVKRGEIWWASLPKPMGSGPGFRHPVIIVQSDDFNQSRIATVVAVVVTSNLRLGEAPGNVFLSKKLTRLGQDSIANISQIITLDKSLLTEKIGRLTPNQQQQLDEGLKLILSLGSGNL